MSPITHEQLRSGTVWETKFPQLWKIIVQWIDSDEYILLSEPDAASHGGTSTVAHRTKDGKIILNAEEAVAFLTKMEARRVSEKLVLCENTV